MNKPKISFVIPSYNQATYLESCLRSVLSQKVYCREILVLDGGSTDGTVDILRRYDSHLDFWRSEKDGGQTAAINEGVRRATGDVIAWLNSDDMYAPGALRLVQDAFASDPELGFVFGDRAYLRDDGVLIGWESRSHYDPLSMGYSIWSEAAFFRKSLWERLGGFDESLECVMDIDFFLRAAKSARYRRLRRILGYFRLQENQKTQLMPDLCKEEGERIWKAHTNLNIPGEIRVGKAEYLSELLRNPSALALPFARGWVRRKLRDDKR